MARIADIIIKGLATFKDRTAKALGEGAHADVAHLLSLVLAIWDIIRRSSGPRAKVRKPTQGPADSTQFVEMGEAHAAREGRVYVVTCSPHLVTSAHQARQVGKDMMMWLGKECAIERLLPDGMVTSKERTEEHVLTVLEHWLEQGELSIVAKRTTAQQRNRNTQQRERGDRDSPWVVVITLSSAMMTTGKRLWARQWAKRCCPSRGGTRHWRYRRTCTIRSGSGTLASATKTSGVGGRTRRSQGERRLNYCSHRQNGV
jgi:hypothetical protein